MPLTQQERDLLNAQKAPKSEPPEGFGNVKPPVAEQIDEPELDATEAAAELAHQTLDTVAHNLVARSYKRHQAVQQIESLSTQLAQQDAAADYFVLSGAHYENMYRRTLGSLAAAEHAFHQELNFQSYLDRAMAKRAKLPSADRTIAELGLLPEGTA
jgi:hypothetical protein